MRFYRKLAVAAVIGGVALAGMARQASADVFVNWYSSPSKLDATYTCSDSNYGEGGAYMTSSLYGSRSSYTSSCSAGNTASSASSVVTSTATLRAATVQIFNMISTRISSVRAADARNSDNTVTMALADDHNGGAIGLSSGNSRLRGVGIWAQAAFVHVKSTATSTKFNGDIITGMVGVDYKVKNNVLIGISGGYEDTNITTDFNSGNLDATGYLVAPYLSVRINDIFSLDATGGYGWLNYDMDRKETATTGAQFKATSVNARRTFGSITANADLKFRKKSLRKLLVNVNGGATYTRERKDAFTETNQSDTTDTVSVAAQTSRLGQGFIGTRVGYNLGKVNPYVNLRGEWDFSKTKVAVASSQTKPADDNFGLKVGLGLNFNISPRVSGTIHGDTTLLRKDYKEYKGLARVRVEF